MYYLYHISVLYTLLYYNGPMTSYGEFVPTNSGEQRLVPIVRGAPIKVPFEAESIDSSFGLPNDIAERVSHQVLEALGRFGLAPEQVVFSGYSSPDDPDHRDKAEGVFGHGDLDQQGGVDGQYDYFYGTYEDLADGEEGPLAYSATGVTPALGIYDRQKLSALGADGGQVTTTPEALREAMIFEFRPTYVFPE
jgi:hypothetical protein